MNVLQYGNEGFTTYAADAPAFHAEGQVQRNEILNVWEAYYSGMTTNADREFKTREAAEFWVLGQFNREIKEWRQTILGSTTYKSNPEKYAPYLN